MYLRTSGVVSLFEPSLLVAVDHWLFLNIACVCCLALCYLFRDMMLWWSRFWIGLVALRIFQSIQYGTISGNPEISDLTFQLHIWFVAVLLEYLCAWHSRSRIKFPLTPPVFFFVALIVKYLGKPCPKPAVHSKPTVRKVHSWHPV